MKETSQFNLLFISDISMSPTRGKLLFKNKLYTNKIEVRDDGVNLSLYFSGTILQSSMQKSKPHKLIIGYTQYMMLPLLIRIPRNVLLIGIGGGSILRFLHFHFPEIQIDAVDNCATTLEVANKFFSLPKSDRVKILHESGDVFLEDSEKKYDLILIDAFNQGGMAPTIYSQDSLSLCNKKLSEKGLLCCNIWSANRLHLDKIKSFIQNDFSQTLYTPVPKKGNIIAIAGKHPIQWHNLHPNNASLIKMSDKLDLNFTEMVKNTRRSNMSLWQKIHQSINFQTVQ